VSRIKESSDELDQPAVAADEVVIRTPVDGRLSSRLALAIATCGVGYLPLAPGTWGSAVGVGIYLLFRMLFVRAVAVSPPTPAEFIFSLFSLLFLLIIFLVTGIGTWAASRVETLLGRKDPGVVVVDEVSGQLITFLFLPLAAPLWTIVAGFLLFRAYDIVKPYPIRRLESLGGGLGIMADDVLAGIYAAVMLSMIVHLSALF
jgi:phosphatidylglycerophosphatase A